MLGFNRVGNRSLRFFSVSILGALASLSLLGSGCGGEETEGAGGAAACSVEKQTGCAPGLACEEVEGQSPGCFAPIAFKGKVFSATDEKPIEGARVVARDANGAAVSNVAITQADGTYALNVPVKRDANGKPLKIQYTLRTDAAGFQTFPTAPRVALPIDTDTAAGDPPVVQSAATDVALIPLPDTSQFGSIAGKVVADAPGGTLIVAGGATGIADLSGAYEVFNVPAGAGVAVSAYAAGLQIKPNSADVTAGKQTPNIDLEATGPATASVSGKVELVAGASGPTTIVLAVEETFNADVARGEVPKGLRVDNITSTFEIKNVPDGKYVVLAAFENDNKVRDPDVSIGGTEIVHIIVAGQNLPITESFKVTDALEVVSPGAEKLDEVSGTPDFVWGDYSGEDHYEVRLFDALGNKIWEDLAIPGVSGSKIVTAKYGGPALTSGMIYQFRATAIKNGGSPISSTEDLKGVFIYK